MKTNLENYNKQEVLIKVWIEAGIWKKVEINKGDVNLHLR